MLNTTRTGPLRVLIALACLSASPARSDDPAPDRGGRARHAERMSHLDNGTIRLGVDLNLGGAITYLSLAGRDDNVVNNFDWGRQVQMSYYSGPVPFVVGDKQPAPAWRGLGWNPIQSGDCFDHAAKVVEHRNDGKELYVKCVPMQWPLNDVPGECTFESWIALDGPTARVRSRLNNARSDHTQYPARSQELPAVYTNGPYYRLMTYTGAKPFTGDALTRIERKLGEPGPWSGWLATEHWAALVNDDGWGLGVWHPGASRFIGGFAGKPGRGGSHDDPTGYIAPTQTLVLDHNIQHEYEYVLILGKLEAIREHVASHAPRPAPPSYVFAADRQGWSYVNATDTGWPIRGELDVRLDGPDPQLIGPEGFWPADQAPTLEIEAAFQTGEPAARLFWKTHAHDGFGDERSVAIPITPDGQYRTYRARLAGLPHYEGAITGLRIDPENTGRPGDRARFRRIGFVKGGP